MILEVFSKLNNSRILWFLCSEEVILVDQPLTWPLRVLSLDQGLWPWGFLIEGLICFLFFIMSSGTSTYYINNSAGLSSDAYTQVLLLVHYLSQDRALCIQDTPSHAVEDPVAQTCLWGHNHPPWWDVSHACPVAPLSQKGSQGHRRQSPACDSSDSARWCPAGWQQFCSSLFPSHWEDWGDTHHLGFQSFTIPPVLCKHPWKLSG